jgi:CBS domain-containing protein
MMIALAHREQALDERAPADARSVQTASPVPAVTSRCQAYVAADVMTRFPPTIHQSASLWEAWDRLRGEQGQHLILLDDHRRPLGVLDVQTIALEWPPGPLGPHRIPVHTLLRGRTRPRVKSSDDLQTVARTMVGARADAVPVVDKAGRLYGLITLWHYARLAADADTAALDPSNGAASRAWAGSGPMSAEIGR